jgi:hypothetical protein
MNNVPLSSHRAIAREQSNVRLPWPVDAAGVHLPCTQLSRWHRYAFNAEDHGKVVSVTTQDGVEMLTVDGIARTERSPQYSNIEGKDSIEDGHVICEVNEKTTVIKFGPDCALRANNAHLNFTSTSPPADRVVLSVPASALSDLDDPLTDVKLLDDGVERDCSAFSIQGAAYLEVSDADKPTYYMYGERTRNRYFIFLFPAP